MANRKERRAAAKQGAAAQNSTPPDANPGPSPRAAQLFRTAFERQRAGRIPEAVKLYRQILEVEPNHLDSLYHLGALACQSGENEIAVNLLAKAAALNEGIASIHSQLGLALGRLGRLEEAVASHQRALELEPMSAASHGALGNALMENGKAEEAAACYRRVLILEPNHAGAHYSLALALQARGRLDNAASSYRQALAAQPDFSAARYNLGFILQSQRKLNDAATAFEGVLAVQSDLAQAHVSLGNVRHLQGQLDAAAASFEQAIALRPDYAEAHMNLGNVRKDQGPLGEAAAHHEKALALRPDFAEAHTNLAIVLQIQGRLDEAIAHLERALSLRPDLADARSKLLLYLNYRSDLSMEALFSEHRRWDEFHGRQAGQAASFPVRDPDPDRRLRIGYVSGDFHTHPVGYFLTKVLESHNKSAFETFCYSNGDANDDATARLRAAADHWRSIARLSDADAATLISRDGVDILVDLSGHTGANRLAMFAGRVAPLQVSWLGYVATTGLASIDYLLMDPSTAPAGAERWCSEALVRLPHGRLCYAAPDYAPTPVPPPSLKGEPFTFGSFNNIAKIGPEVVTLWSAVLRAAPQSRLLLKWASLADETARRRLSDAFLAEGIDLERVELRGFSPHKEMLAEYGEIDVALDPFPFCGALTTCEALWMGVPVVTLPQERPASRQTLSFLDVLGLSELAASSSAEYIAIAAALAADPERLTNLRASLRTRMAAFPLCDGAVFTGALEAAYREMWRRKCAGESAAAFDVPRQIEASNDRAPS
ncbi:MAG: tetratricopeptide repeat protein [Methylocella sp.]